jgi:phosphoglycerate kinase
LKHVTEFSVKGKRVFLRADLNVPLDRGQIADDTRIRATLPTIKYLLKEKARVVIASHLGRPKGVAAEFSLSPVTSALRELLKIPVEFVSQVIGEEVDRKKMDLREGGLLLLENVRFEKGETVNDQTLSRALAKDIDLYISDAFGSVHRAHASVAGITEFVPEKGCGFLIARELEYLNKLLAGIRHPFVAILGGAKVSDKLKVIENLLTKTDALLIGGAMSYTFLAAKNISVGNSLVELDQVEPMLSLMLKAEKQGKSIVLPLDHVIAKSKDAWSDKRLTEGASIPDGYAGFDIGSKTHTMYSSIVKGAKTIFWTGPMGVFEIPAFAEGTFFIAQACAHSQALSVVGGGDSVLALNRVGVADAITHISTGGGATLEFLEGKTLPGLAALEG